MRNCSTRTSVGDRGVRKECAQWISSALKHPQIRGVSYDLTIKSVKKLMVEPLTTVGLDLCSAAIHDVSYDSLFNAMDVDSVVKGKSKPKSLGFCYICGKIGHKSADCWSKGRVPPNKGSGKTQSANVTFSGKGKSGGQCTDGAKRQPKGHCKSKGKAKGKRKSSGKKGSQSGNHAGSMEFDEDTWEETNQMQLKTMVEFMD